jgi:hypothetical protein
MRAGFCPRRPEPGEVVDLMGTDLVAKTRAELASLLDQCGELADGVRYFEDEDLVLVLDTLDSIRALIADNSTTLRAAISR